MNATTNRRVVLGAMIGAGAAGAAVALPTAASGVPTLSAKDAAIIERVRRRYYQPGRLERGLEILGQEIECREKCTALAKRIGELVLQREANAQAVKVSRFALPEPPTELTAVYRGPFGPVRVEVDPEWLREMIPTFSPRSRRGRQLQRLLRLHEERYTRAYAAREASGLGALIRERERIDRELEAAAEEARGLEGHSLPSIALQAAAMLAARSGPKDAPAIIPGLLKFTGAA